MIYFIYNDNYCEASEINEQLAEKVQYITEDEYRFWQENSQEEEEQPIEE